MKRLAGWQLGLMVTSVVLVVGAVMLGSSRRARPRAAPAPSPRATERWEGEGGAVSGEPT